MSKKLDKNGLWESSRMMLPEHREMLVQRRKQPPESQDRPNVPTQEELTLIRNYALLPVMLSVVENNYKRIETSSYPLKKLYIAATQALMNLVHADLSQTRKALKERNIKVFEDERADSAIHYRFICRGYEDKFSLIRDVVKAEISVRMAKYIAKIFSEPPNQ